MRVAHWHPEPEAPEQALATHLHGRDLEVVSDPVHHAWHWRVTTCHGTVLAEGDAPGMTEAEQAAEDEATAIHPPTADLVELLLS
ncbi:MAG TPA: hypothetical protein VES19_10985 [Candidatus Limnocylindrales bacterium]|nr:hypothetical protein [Candidatus Limnocylindrales bacterium]